MPWSKLILLVEDSPDDEELMLRALRRQRVEGEVAVVRDGEEAVRYLVGSEAHTAEPLPDLVLLDLKLPKLGGFEVLEKMRESSRTRLVPVVVMTSSSQDEDIVRSFELGANSYVRKQWHTMIFRMPFGRWVPTGCLSTNSLTGNKQWKRDLCGF